MIIADKIIMLRKKNGWSQEELADRVNVSRQSVSKWESAQSIPDINKILEMSKIFGVTTDYLLRDDIEKEEFTDSVSSDSGNNSHFVSLKEATEYMTASRKNGISVGIATVLCILSPVVLILLSGEASELLISDVMATVIGPPVLLVMVAVAVAIFILSGSKMNRFEYLRKEAIELEYGVSGIVSEKRTAFEGKFNASVISGIVLCILGVIPLIISAALEKEIFIILSVCFLLIFVAIAVFLFISFGSVKSSYDQLLCDGEFTPENKEKEKKSGAISGVYWPLVVAGYLLWSFLTNDWRITWIVWPIAGIIYGGIMAALKLNKD